ncbi:DMT family transporter [Amorphus sp. MBR-141]
MSNPRERKRAALWMIGCILSLTAMALVVRALAGDLSVFQILFFRSVGGIPVLVAVALFKFGRDIRKGLVTQVFPMHVLRNGIHLAAQLGWIYAVASVPLATVFAVEFSALVWGVVLAALILGEQPNARQVGGVLLGLAGIGVILQPWAASLTLGMVAILLATFGFAGTWLSTRILARTEAPLAILFWMCIVQSPLSLVLSLTDWLPVPLAAVPFLVLLALCSLSAHFCLSNALRLATVAQVAPFDYLRLPLATAAGTILYHEPVEEGVLLGGAVVLAGVVLSQARARGGRAASGQ